MTMTATGKFLCMAHRLILLWLNPFGLSVDSEVVGALYVIFAGWLVSEGAENVSWPWLFQLRGWGSLTMTSICKFV